MLTIRWLQSSLHDKYRFVNTRRCSPPPTHTNELTPGVVLTPNYLRSHCRSLLTVIHNVHHPLSLPFRYPLTSAVVTPTSGSFVMHFTIRPVILSIRVVTRRGQWHNDDNDVESLFPVLCISRRIRSYTIHILSFDLTLFPFSHSPSIPLRPKHHFSILRISFIPLHFVYPNHPSNR